MEPDELRMVFNSKFHPSQPLVIMVENLSGNSPPSISAAMADFSDLPEELIQHIQSFLDPKESVRTSVLSKPWYVAWSTNPILSLHDRYFPMIESPNFAEFSSFARRRINKYQELDRKLSSLSLFISVHNDDSTILADELLLHALDSGVSRLVVGLDRRYRLPSRVFAHVKLKTLRLYGCRIDLTRVLCSCLVSLTLYGVCVSNDMMRDILLGCPLIEDLDLLQCEGLEIVNLSVVRRTLKTFEAFPRLNGPKLLVEWEEDDPATGSRVVARHQYPNLMSLKLSRVEVDRMFFRLLSNRFPCLGKFIIDKVELEDGLVNVEIANNSLRHFCYRSLTRIDSLRIHAPNINYFYFNTEYQQHIPYLSFGTASAEWKSLLEFKHPYDTVADVSWFMKIGDILKAPNLSKISLVIDLSGVKNFSGITGVPTIVTSPFVENLTLRNCPRVSSCSVVLFVWLWCCRPKFITWSGVYSNEDSSYKILELVHNELKMHAYKKSGHTLPFIDGLEEVEMETYEKYRGKLQHRLRLKWN